MRTPLLLLALLFAPSTALAADIEIEATTTVGPSNCIPFGGWSSPSAYSGFVYQNIPAFELQAGDTIAFDLGAANDVPIDVSIDLAAATSNGSMQESTAGWTRVVTNSTAADPDGDSIQGNFELEFTVSAGFTFAGGGLLIRVSRDTSSSFYSDSNCTQVLMYGNASDASGYFVGRFYGDSDGGYPWSGTSNSVVGNVQIDCPTASTVYEDDDEDGYGDPTAPISASCTGRVDGVTDSSDCDDGDAAVYPGADEYCNGIDDDCDVAIDEDDALDVITWYQDSDSDGYGNASVADIDCDQPSGFIIDNTDCDDTSAAVFPGATETCNTIDDDCDGTIDEDDAVGVSTWYQDSDADGYGNASATDIDCYQPTGFVSDSTDCDDTVATTYPGADEYCNSVDDDCDGTIDEDAALDVVTWYRDSDTDGFGDAATTDIDCSQPSGFVADATDCDDAVATTYPGADEYCNSVDDDCDGTIDEDDAVDVITWHQDSDSDGYGDASISELDCDQPTGMVEDDTDCDDSVATTFPGADEYCNSVDDDCDTIIDEDDAVDVVTWFQDGDSDGYGDPSTSDIDCDQPTGMVEDDTDCDDTDASIYPGAPEIEYDGIDQDCDSEDLCDVDEDSFNALECGGSDCDDEDGAINVDAAEIWYDGIDQDCDELSDYDADYDGYDSESYAGEDCDDDDPDTYPGAPDENYDGIINDCDEADEYDADGDGYSSADYGGDDCDDANSAINSEATEIWYDGVDQDCDGEDDDQDADGYLNAEDCDDTDPDSYPGAEGLDENCDEIEEDTDGLGTETDTEEPDGAGLDGATGGGGVQACGDNKAGSGLGFLALLGLGLGMRRRRRS